MPNNIFKERFKSLRRFRKISQQELADGLHTSKSSVNMYERGERTPKFDMMKTIADYFNVSPAWLAGYTDEADKADKAESHIEIRCEGNKTRVLVDGKEISGNIVHLSMEIVVQSDDEQ